MANKVTARGLENYIVTVQDPEDFTMRYVENVNNFSGTYSLTEDEDSALKFLSYGSAQVSVINIYRNMKHTECGLMFGIQPVSKEE